MKGAAALWAATYAVVAQYVFNDWNFAGSLMVLVMVDTATGIRASLVLRQHQSGRLRQVFSKLFQYGAALVCCHVLTSHLVDGHANTIFQVVAPGFKASLYLLLLWTETISIEENLNKTGQGFLPKWVRSKMASWTESGEVSVATAVKQTANVTTVAQQVTITTPTPAPADQTNEDPTL